MTLKRGAAAWDKPTSAYRNDRLLSNAQLLILPLKKCCQKRLLFAGEGDPPRADEGFFVG